MRRAELAGLKVADVDFELGVAAVLGKGRRPRACPIGRKTAQALDRYLRVRARHRDADRPELWLGHAGPMTPNGVYQVVRRRSIQAGMGPFHPHLFRHTFGHQWLAAGGAEGDLMRLAGWRSRSMVGRYASARPTSGRGGPQAAEPGGPRMTRSTRKLDAAPRRQPLIMSRAGSRSKTRTPPTPCVPSAASPAAASLGRLVCANRAVDPNQFDAQCQAHYGALDELDRLLRGDGRSN